MAKERGGVMRDFSCRTGSSPVFAIAVFCTGQLRIHPADPVWGAAFFVSFFCYRIFFCKICGHIIIARRVITTHCNLVPYRGQREAAADYMGFITHVAQVQLLSLSLILSRLREWIL